MATKKYLDETGLADVAGHVNSRLKTVSTMPVTADLNAVRLYTGEDTQTYKKGHIYQMAATEQNFLQFSADTTTYFMSEDGTITSTAPTSYTSQVEDIPFTDESTGATLVYMAGNNALVQKLENDVNVITVNFNKIKTSVMPWWTAGAATGSYNPFTIRNVQLVAVTAWVDITSGGGIKTVTVMPENPTDKDVVIYIGESGMVYEQNHIYQYDLAEDEWIDITAVVPDEEAREVAAGAMALAEEAFETSTKIWKGSEADWDLLPISEKIKYDYVAFDEEDDPITAATLPYDNTESGLVSTNVQGAIDEVVDAIPKPTVSTTSPYTKLGVQLGAVPGNVRSRSEPISTVLILGNSLTGCHLTYTVDGKSVDELREVGATHPNSGWIGLIHDYLVTIYPNIKIYKTNAAIWEQTTHSEGRSYNLIKDLEVYEVTDNGSFVVPNKTVNDILPLADFVTIDLFENIQDCVAATNVSELAGDYDNLLLELKAVNNNAFYSLFFGFWYDKWKKAALLNTRLEWNFWGEPSFLPCWMSDNRYYCGEAMQYGIDGSEIGTIVPAAATHPNDDAYYLMACQWLNHVFNVSNKNRCPVYTPDTRAATLASHDIFNPPQQSSYDFNTDIKNTGEYPSIHPIKDRYYYAMPGNYTAGLLCGITKGLGTENISINPAYGLLSISYVSGSYVMDFTGAWTQSVTQLYGFVIRECLLYAIGGAFKPHYLGKYQIVNQNDEYPVNFDDFLLDAMTDWIIDPSERRIRGVAKSTRDTGYPAEGWFELWTSCSDANQSIQYCITPGGQRYVRNRSPTGWGSWAAY